MLFPFAAEPEGPNRHRDRRKLDVLVPPAPPTNWGTMSAPHSLRIRVLAERLRRDDGSATAEYAIATLAAVGFAGLLVVILRSDAVRGMLTNLIQHALSYSG
jgi:hypothetical protein